MVSCKSVFFFLAVGIVLAAAFGGVYKVQPGFFVLGAGIIAISLFHVGKVRFSGRPIHYEELMRGFDYEIVKILDQSGGMAYVRRTRPRWPFKETAGIVAGIPVGSLNEGKFRVYRGETAECD